MKKLLSFVIVAVLCMTFAVSAMAEEYTLDASGNAVFKNTIGYSFRIDDVNGTIEGEDSTILTSVDGLAGCGVWSVYLVADYVSENVYVAATNGTAMGGNPANVTSLKDGQIIVVIHSASSRPTEAATYPNWEECARASAIHTGDYLILSGIDLATGACTNGTMTVSATNDGADSSNGDVSEEEESSAAESSAAESSEIAAESSVAVSSSASSVAESSDVSADNADEGGLGVWLYVIIGVAVLAVIAVVAVVLKKKK